MDMKIETTRPLPEMDGNALKEFLSTKNQWGEALFVDSAGDYFLPMRVVAGEVEGIVFSPLSEMTLLYSYGKNSPVRFRRVNEPTTVTLTFNQ